MPVEIVAGGSAFGNRPPFTTDEDVAKGFAILKANGIVHIDSSQAYGISEATLGKNHAGDHFTIDTKWGVRAAVGDPTLAWATKDYIVQSAHESVARLGVKQVDTFYLHFPDNNTPFEETMDAIDTVYRQGLFRRFGLSNFSAASVQAFHDYAKAKGYVLPAVYQGQYSPISRHYEADLFPLLRKLGIAFFAFSPLAGGLLTKSAQDFHDGKGRFIKGTPAYNTYNKPGYLNSLVKWEAAASDEGISRAELAYRWVAWHSILSEEHGDAVLVGASSLAQLDETLKWIVKGKLSDKAVAAIQKVWEGVEAETPLES